MKILPGTMTSAVVHGGADGRRIMLELRDTSSSIVLFRVEMAPDSYGLMLSGLSGRPCKYEISDHVQHAGCTREHKEEVVPWNKGYLSKTAMEQARREAVAPFEVDGWRAWKDDIGNMHRRTDGGYRVSFSRLVKPNGEPVL